MGNFCGSCGAVLSADARFCGGCGTTLVAQAGSMASSAGREWTIGLPLVLAAIAAGALGWFNVDLFRGPWVLSLEAEWGWPRSEIAAGAQISVLISLIISPLVGSLVDQLGARRIALIGVPTCALSLFAVSMIQSTTSIYLIGTFAAVFAVALSSCVILGPICRTFTTSRGMAVGLALAGALAAYLITFWIGIFLVLEKGWREVFTLLPPVLGTIAFLFVVLLIPSHGTQRALPRVQNKLEPHASHLQLFALLFAYAVAVGLFAVLVPNLNFLLADQGVAFREIAKSVTVLGLLGCGGMLLVGFAEDRFGGLLPILAGYGLAVVAIVLAIDVPSLALPVAHFAMGMVTVSTIVRCSRMVPAHRYGLALGTVQSFGAGGSLITFLCSTLLGS